MRSPLLVSVVTPCYNEVENLLELVSRVQTVLKSLDYDFEHIVIDNASTDGSQSLLRELALKHEHLRVIINARNFGHVRSPFHALLQARGDCVILIVADLQDPPELIPTLVSHWEAGFQVAFLVKNETEERGVMRWGRRIYYRLLQRLTTSEIVADATGAGVYDRSVVNYLKQLNDPYPYVRGLIGEMGIPIAKVPFVQPLRVRGRSKSSFAGLYDLAMLGFTTHSRVPLRLASLVGFAIAGLSLLTGVVYLCRKLFDWSSFDLGVAPLAIGLFFLGAVQLISLGILGEYVGNIFLRIRNLPLVVESERINFPIEES